MSSTTTTSTLIAAATDDKLLRITSLLHRKPGTSLSQFLHYWRYIHGPLVTPFLLSAGVTEYRQYHPTLGAASALGRPGIDADGIAEVFVRQSKFEAFLAAFGSSEYRDVVKPDEERFLDTDRMELEIGEEVTFVVGGEMAGGRVKGE